MEENKLLNGYDKCIAIIYSLQVYRSSFNTHLSIFLEKIDMNFELLCKTHLIISTSEMNVNIDRFIYLEISFSRKEAIFIQIPNI